MKIIIISECIVKYDAISNDVIGEFKTLKNKNYSVFIYAERYDKEYKNFIISKRKFKRYLKNSENILLVHYGYYWGNIENIINNANAKIIIKYHNITPSYFFKPYSDYFVKQIELGEKQIKNIINNYKINKYLADSKYNRDELVSLGVSSEKVFVLPPFHKVNDFANSKINFRLLEKLLDGKINVLFVGRVAPNKGHIHLINTMKYYVKFYGKNIRLIFIGGLEPSLKTYHSYILNLIDENNLNDIVLFEYSVSFDDLHTYYIASHIFLLMSEHEGFCVPILEAQYHRLPIIALDRTAVKDTLGEEQLLFQDLDYEVFASAINVVANNNDIRIYLAEKGFSNYLKYELSTLSDKLLGVIDD